MSSVFRISSQKITREISLKERERGEGMADLFKKHKKWGEKSQSCTKKAWKTEIQQKFVINVENESVILCNTYKSRHKVKIFIRMAIMGKSYLHISTKSINRAKNQRFFVNCIYFSVFCRKKRGKIKQIIIYIFRKKEKLANYQLPKLGNS